MAAILGPMAAILGPVAAILGPCGRHFGAPCPPFWGPMAAILGPHARYFGVRSIEGRNRPQVVLSHVFSSLILSFSPVFSQVEHQNNFPMP